MACPHCAGEFNVPRSGTQQLSPSLGNFVNTRSQSAHLAMTTGGIAQSEVRFSFTCLRCGSILEARGNLCGQKGRCPTCGAVFTVPMVDPQTGVALGAPEVADDGQLPTPMHAYANAGDRAPKIVRKPDGTQAIQCPRCMRQMPVDANICVGCGIPFTMEGASTVVQTSPAHNSQAGWALTLGVLSILMFCFPAPAPVAIWLGWSSYRKTRSHAAPAGRGLAIAGILLGTISLLMSGIFYYLKWF